MRCNILWGYLQSFLVECKLVFKLLSQFERFVSLVYWHGLKDLQISLWFIVDVVQPCVDILRLLLIWSKELLHNHLKLILLSVRRLSWSFLERCHVFVWYWIKLMERFLVSASDGFTHIYWSLFAPKKLTHHVLKFSYLLINWIIRKYWPNIIITTIVVACIEVVNEGSSVLNSLESKIPPI